MGQPNSLPSRERRRSVRSLKLSSFYSKSHKRSMSATFYILDHDMTSNLLNINTATEEQLMTLPSISREKAHNIVEYRQRIGKFKRVDDLALVSGIGAEKLNDLRSEICVKDFKQNTDRVSTSISSLDSDRTQEISCVNRYTDLNSAGIFDLQSIAGVTQEIAANIIHYREKKGRFKSIEDLRKVKGIDNLRFSVLRTHFIVNLDSIIEINANNNFPSNGFCKFSDVKPKLNSNACLKNSSDVVTVNNNHPPLNDIFDLLSAYSHRPAVEDFRYHRNNKAAIRIATWNLHALTLEKAHNLGFLEVCCRTILENRFSIVAVQEIEDNDALKVICDELNTPKLRRVAEWLEKHNQTRCVYQYFCTSKCGFIVNVTNDHFQIDCDSENILQISFDDSSIASIQIRINQSFQLILLNVWSHTSGISVETIRKYLDSENVIILGDFTGSHNNEDLANEFVQYISALPPTIRTNSAITDECVPFLDNIYLSETLRCTFTGCAGIVREGLSHLAIPRGWTWGGVASEHCPVWCEFYVNEQSSPNNFTNTNHHSLSVTAV